MKWDAGANTRWDSLPLLHWDRPTPPVSPTVIKMQPFKILINYNHLGNPRYLDKARYILLCLTSEPLLTLVPDPLPHGIPTRAALTTAFNDFEAAFDLSKDSKAAKKDRKKKRAILDTLLKLFAPCLETAAIAANDITILEKSGFDLRKPIIQPTTNGIPAAPLVTAKRGKVSRSVLLRVKPVLKHVASWEAEYAIGESTADANFHGRITSASGTRITYTDLELGKLHQFRVRGIGRTGPGDWSDPVGIIVT